MNGESVSRHRATRRAGLTPNAIFGLLFGGLLVLILLILTESLDEVLPDGLAEHVARNNEGYFFALLLAVWIEYAREPVSASTRRFAATGIVAASLTVAGALLLLDGVPGTLATLNESCFALAVLVPYVQLPRPVPRWAWAVPVAAVVVPLVGAGNEDINLLAELFGLLLLVTLSLDWVDRTILEPSVSRRLVGVVAWMAVVSAAAVTFHALRPAQPDGVVDEVLLYLSRMVEVAVAVLILHLYFSILRPFSRKALSRA